MMIINVIVDDDRCYRGWFHKSKDTIDLVDVGETNSPKMTYEILCMFIMLEIFQRQA